MRMKPMLLLLLALCLVLGLCACTNTADGANQTADGKVTYRIKVVDEASKPMPNVMVQLCSDSCFPATTDQAGVAEFNLVEAEYKAAVTVMPAGYEAEAAEFRFPVGSYELTITLKPVSQGF